MKRRFNVKVKPLKFEGFCNENTEEDGDGGREKTIVVQMKWNGPKSVFVPFYRSSSKRHRRSCSTGQRSLRNGEETIEWDDDEFESICDFSIVSKDGSFGSWVVSFSVLYGEVSDGQSKTNKLVSLGKASLNLAEVVAANMESKVEQKLPIISSKADGAATNATLLEGDVTSIDNESCNPVDWELKELVSRDGGTKLKSNVFFASFDQRSEKAAGESACTALVAVIADWLHSNQDIMPTRLEYDTLITDGSSEWRKLCDNETYSNFFPDKHFDLETVLKAGLKPVTVLPEKSFTGFFSPEKFQTLHGAMSFDEIWDAIANQTEYYGQPRIYIVSWNDHFFVLKVEADAYYIIDSLGERLFEGCNKAYILKFDYSTSMYAKLAKDEIEPVDLAASDENVSHKDDEYSTSTFEKVAKEEVGSNNNTGKEEMICSGKECCKEYIKRFLAAIPLGELEAEEKKGTTCTFSLHQRLQIDFHYSSSATSSLSSSATSTHSLFTSD